MRALVVLPIAAIVLAGPAFAEDAACSGFKWPLDRELKAFQADDLPNVASGALPGLMEAVTLKLAPQDQVSYPVPPTRKPKHEPAYGGTFTLPPIAAAGTYQVTISGDAWIDLVQGGKTLKQVGFTGSHGCTIVHKSVRFDLGTGPATIEISDAATDSLKLDVLPKE